MNDKDWNDLMVEHELAYLRGDLATSSPESYTIEEMKEISNDMFASTERVEAAIRKDFQELPHHAQSKMLGLLLKADSDNLAWWTNLLTGGPSRLPGCR
ncbi:MAG: hypothetical protein J6S36_05650 [Eggerthellaceae bacterium]|nr:hypothetical protein [Eggerthellaceae bacterium]